MKPYIIKNLDGDKALKLNVGGQCKSIIEIARIHGVVELDEEEQKQYANCKTILLTSWGSVKTEHTLECLEDLLYPYDEEVC